MELDKKIKVKKIFDVFSDIEEVKKYYGKEVYCADFTENFSNLKLYTDRKILKMFFPQECKPFLCSGKQHRYILPCEFVEQEKQYRPCTLDNFGLNIGDLIRFRRKNDHNHEVCTMYMGHIKTNGTVKVLLGQCYYSFEVLFDDYEWFDKDSNTWEIFGVEE